MRASVAWLWWRVALVGAFLVAGVASTDAIVRGGPVRVGRPVHVAEVRSGTGLVFRVTAERVRDIDTGAPGVCLGGSRTNGHRNFGDAGACFSLRLPATAIRAESEITCRARTVVFYGLVGRRIRELDLLLPAGHHLAARLVPIPRSFRLRGSFFVAAVAEPRRALYGHRLYGQRDGPVPHTHQRPIHPYVHALVGLDRHGQPVAAKSANPPDFAFPPCKCRDTVGGFTDGS